MTFGNRVSFRYEWIGILIGNDKEYYTLRLTLATSLTKTGLPTSHKQSGNNNNKKSTERNVSVPKYMLDDNSYSSDEDIFGSYELQKTNKTLNGIRYKNPIIKTISWDVSKWKLVTDIENKDNATNIEFTKILNLQNERYPIKNSITNDITVNDTNNLNLNDSNIIILIDSKIDLEDNSNIMNLPNIIPQQLNAIKNPQTSIVNTSLRCRYI